MANMLTQQEHFKASLYINDHCKNLEGLSRPEIAKRVSSAVGFPVTEHNVAAIADMLGLKDKLRGPHGRGPGTGSTGRTRERDIARAIIEIVEALGITLSNEHRIREVIQNHKERS